MSAKRKGFSEPKRRTRHNGNGKPRRVGVIKVGARLYDWRTSGPVSPVTVRRLEDGE